MDDREFIEHLEEGHMAALKMKFKTDYPMTVRPLWEVFHDALHRMVALHLHYGEPDHDHPGERDMTRPKSVKWVQQTGCVCLDPPQHSDGCPGKRGVLILEERHGVSIVDALWEEMDRLMEGLMTETDAEDGGDRFRAQGLAFALAVFMNPAAPDVNVIRNETMSRWLEAQK